MNEQGYVVLVPVKPPARGKSRLAGISATRRRDLAEAFARDTIAAALEAVSVHEVLVVTDDFRLARALAATGCSVLPDGVSGDLNATLVQAAAEAGRRWPGLRPAVLCADLPALRPQDLDAVLATVGPAPAFVPDLEGGGTTLYTAGLPDFLPCFGPGSAAAHRTSGAVELGGAAAGLRQDVDEPGDLGRVLALGVGPHTARVTGRRDD